MLFSHQSMQLDSSAHSLAVLGLCNNTSWNICCWCSVSLYSSGYNSSSLNNRRKMFSIENFRCTISLLWIFSRLGWGNKEHEPEHKRHTGWKKSSNTHPTTSLPFISQLRLLLSSYLASASQKWSRHRHVCLSLSCFSLGEIASTMWWF